MTRFAQGKRAPGTIRLSNSRKYAAAIAWVATSYLLSVAVCIPVSGWLGDRFGTKSTYLIALAIFTAFISGKQAMGLGPVRAVRDDW